MLPLLSGPRASAVCAKARRHGKARSKVPRSAWRRDAAIAFWMSSWRVSSFLYGLLFFFFFFFFIFRATRGCTHASALRAELT